MGATFRCGRPLDMRIDAMVTDSEEYTLETIFDVSAP